jgi:hypothetical protein
LPVFASPWPSPRHERFALRLLLNKLQTYVSDQADPLVIRKLPLKRFFIDAEAVSYCQQHLLDSLRDGSRLFHETTMRWISAASLSSAAAISSA